MATVSMHMQERQPVAKAIVARHAMAAEAQNPEQGNHIAKRGCDPVAGPPSS